MKIDDILDYFRFRKSVENAWDCVRLRKNPGQCEYFEVRFKDGRVFCLRPATRDRHVFHRLFMKDSYHVLTAPSDGFDCVIDIGGHIGTFSFLMAPVARRVLVFEPVSENFKLLKRNLSGPHFEHVRCVHAAVGDRKGEIKMYISAEASGSHSAHTTTGNHFEIVSGLSLEDVFIEYDIERCDLLKVDCEGSEYEILFSAGEDLISRISRIVLEYHEMPGHGNQWNGNSLRGYLETMGFNVTMKPSKRRPKQGIMLCNR